jgi:hypothetical protein
VRARPRSLDEPAPWMFHLMAVHGAESLEVSYETDRAGLHRARAHARRAAALDAAARSRRQGSVLDPDRRDPPPHHARAAADRDHRHRLGHGRDARGAPAPRRQVPGPHLADRVFDLAWTHSWVTLRQINATESDAQLYARLASSVIYANASLRAEPRVLLRNRRGQSGLWSYAISGDLPIVLLQVGDAENIELVRSMVQAHAYWRLKGLAVDLVI